MNTKLKNENIDLILSNLKKDQRYKNAIKTKTIIIKEKPHSIPILGKWIDFPYRPT